MRTGLIFAIAGVLLPSGGSAQLLPPSPEAWKAQVAFFSSLPNRFPVANIESFEKLVADDVQVYRDGVLIHRTRTDWLKELQDYKQESPSDPQGFSVSRDQYNILENGSVSVREFTYPIAPEGKTIAYHPKYPSRYVTYKLTDSKLVRIDYGPAMSNYAGLCQAVGKIKKKSGGHWVDQCG